MGADDKQGFKNR